MISKITFQNVAGQFKSKNQHSFYMSQCEKNYEIKIYRVNTMKLDQATSYYQDLKQKYQEGQLREQTTSWHQNQRRLFIWFLVCFIRLYGKQALNSDKSWDQMSDIFFNKDIRLLKYQYENILKSTQRVYWISDEDDIMLQAIEKYGIGEWNQIAKQIYFSGKSKHFKSPKHCRERWQNHLNTQIKKTPWTDQEDLQVLKYTKEHGKKWAKISIHLKGSRTEHMIKNRYNSLVSHQQQGENQSQKVNILIQKIEERNNSERAKFKFFDNIIKIKKQEKIQDEEQILHHVQQSQSQMKKERNQKKQFVTTTGLSIINCGNGKLDPFFSEKFVSFENNFVTNSGFLFQQIKSENYWQDKTICHTPGQLFFQDKNFDKQMQEWKFQLQSKGSFQKSSVAASMEFLRPRISQISQQLKMINASTQITTNSSTQFIPLQNDDQLYKKEPIQFKNIFTSQQQNQSLQQNKK